MKGIATCKDCEFYITIYRFSGKQGFFSIAKKWCEEYGKLISQGIVPSKETLIKALTDHKIVAKPTELDKT